MSTNRLTPKTDMERIQADSIRHLRVMEIHLRDEIKRLKEEIKELKEAGHGK